MQRSTQPRWQARPENALSRSLVAPSREIKMPLSVGLSLVMSLLLAACNTGPYASAPIGSQSARAITVRYATVEHVSRGPLRSNMPAGAMIGGVTGLILGRKESPGEQLAAGLGGALLGGMATKVIEGERLAYQYHLRYRNGVQRTYVTEKNFLVIGDCVAVETGGHSNLRRVAASYCNGNRNVSSDQLAMADACYAAKDQLLGAQGAEAIELASQKVEVLCQYQ